MSRPRILLPLLAAGLLAACGSEQPDQLPRTDSGSGPKASGSLVVAPLDGRIGDATAATRDGLRRLSGARRIDSDRTRAPRRREGVGAGAACADADIEPAAANLAAIRAATMCLVNGERHDAGLPLLASNDLLARSSVAHSEDMVRQSYFSHESRDGRGVVDRVRATGYLEGQDDWMVGENLAWGTGTLATPREIVQAWMSSPGHRANILRDGYREAGVGVWLGNPEGLDGLGATYTMNYGARSGAELADTAAGTATTKLTSSSSRRLERKRRVCLRRAGRARTATQRRKRAARCRSRASRRRLH